MRRKSRVKCKMSVVLEASAQDSMQDAQKNARSGKCWECVRFPRKTPRKVRRKFRGKCDFAEQLPE